VNGHSGTCIVQIHSLPILDSVQDVVLGESSSVQGEHDIVTASLLLTTAVVVVVMYEYGAPISHLGSPYLNKNFVVPPPITNWQDVYPFCKPVTGTALPNPSSNRQDSSSRSHH
jgi:hypothetical protein